MSNYTKISRMLKVVQEVDKKRRELWHEETFGEAEQIVNDFCSDDIPF